MRVRDLLQSELLPGLRVLAGEAGVNRRVSSVSVMDAPDIADWMRGGEFLITSGYTIETHPVKLEQLICDLNRNQVAALGIKVDRFIHSMPEQVLDTANQLGFPVLYIPKRYAFVDIINPVLSEIVNRQARQLLYSDEIHNSFLDLALGGRSIQEVVDTLSRIIQKDVVFKDHVFHHTYLSPQADPHKLTAATTVNHRVATATDSYGYLYVLDGGGQQGGKYERIAMEHASTVLILMLQKKISNREIEYRYRSELIRDILTGNYRSLEEIQARAALYGWSFRQGVRVIVYDIDDFKMGYLRRSKKDKPLERTHALMTHTIKAYLSTRFPCYYIQYSDTIVFLVQYDSADERDIRGSLIHMNDEINSEIKNGTGYTVTIGVGDHKPGVETASESYAEAKLAVEVGRSSGKRGCTVFYSDLGIYRLLYDIYDVVQERDFVDETLMPLIEYDQQHDTEFYQTLVRTVELDWNLQRTSEALHIHYNTAKYRLKRVEEILNLDLSMYENKLKIALAVCCRNIAAC
ncbi:MAG: PucR family transcriptional regulator [bacterium]